MSEKTRAIDAKTASSRSTTSQSRTPVAVSPETVPALDTPGGISAAQLQRTYGNRRVGMLARPAPDLHSAPKANFDSVPKATFDSARRHIVQRMLEPATSIVSAPSTQQLSDPFFRATPQGDRHSGNKVFATISRGAPTRIQRVHQGQQMRRDQAQDRESNIEFKLKTETQNLVALQARVQKWRDQGVLPRLVLGRIEVAEQKIKEVRDREQDGLHHSAAHAKLWAAKTRIEVAGLIWTEIQNCLNALLGDSDRAAVLGEVDVVEKKARGSVTQQIQTIAPHLTYFADFAPHFNLALETFRGQDPRNANAARAVMARYAPFGYDKALYESTQQEATTAATAGVDRGIESLRQEEISLTGRVAQESDVKNLPKKSADKKRAVKAKQKEWNDELEAAKQKREAAEASRGQDIAALQQRLFDKAQNYIRDNGTGSDAEINAIATFAVRESKGDEAKLDQLLRGFKNSGPNVTAALYQEVYAITGNGDHAAWALSTAEGGRDGALDLATRFKAGKGSQQHLGDLFKWTNDLSQTLDVRLKGRGVAATHAIYRALYEAVLQAPPASAVQRAALDAAVDSLHCGGDGVSPERLEQMITACKTKAGAVALLVAVAALGADSDRLGVMINERKWKNEDIALVMGNAAANQSGPSAAHLHSLIKYAMKYVLSMAHLAVCVRATQLPSWDSFVTLAGRFLSAGNKGNTGKGDSDEFSGSRSNIRTIRPAGRQTDIYIRARESRLNHFVEGHTYKDFKFTGSNIARRTDSDTGEAMPSSIWTDQSFGKTQVSQQISTLVQDANVQQIADNVAQYDYERNRATTRNNRTIRLTNIDRTASSKPLARDNKTGEESLFVTQFYPRGTDAYDADPANLRAMACFYGLFNNPDA